MEVPAKIAVMMPAKDVCIKNIWSFTCILNYSTEFKPQIFRKFF